MNKHSIPKWFARRLAQVCYFIGFESAMIWNKIGKRLDKYGGSKDRLRDLLDHKDKDLERALKGAND